MKRIIFCCILVTLLLASQRAYAETISIFGEYNSLNDAGAGARLFLGDFALEGIYYPSIESNSTKNSLGGASFELDGYSVNGLYFFNMVKTKNGPYTGVPYAGIDYLRVSGEAETYYNSNEPLQTTGTGDVEYTWEYLNIFGGYCWGNKNFFIDARLGGQIGLKFESSPCTVTSSNEWGTMSYTYPKQESRPASKAYFSIAGGMRF